MDGSITPFFYTATGTVNVPNANDTGDYHFMYKVTDQSGWQTLMGLALKWWNNFLV